MPTPHGFKLSEETKAKLSRSLKGRSVSEETRKKMSAAQRGVPQPLHGKNCANEDHCFAKYWELISPDKTYYRFKNLDHFIRQHSHLFEPGCLVVKHKRTKASSGLGSLFHLRKDGRITGSWHGWTIGEKSKEDLRKKWEVLHGNSPRKAGHNAALSSDSGFIAGVPLESAVITQEFE